MIEQVIKILKNLSYNIELYSVNVDKIEHINLNYFSIRFSDQNFRYCIIVNTKDITIKVFDKDFRDVGTNLYFELNDEQRYEIFHLSQILYQQCKKYTTYIFSNFVNECSSTLEVKNFKND